MGRGLTERLLANLNRTLYHQAFLLPFAQINDKPVFPCEWQTLTNEYYWY